MRTSTAAPRKALHAYVSDEAHELWFDFASSNGVSVSAILEALAPGLRESNGSESVIERMDKVVNDARRTDAQRRRRQHSGSGSHRLAGSHR